MLLRNGRRPREPTECAERRRKGPEEGTAGTLRSSRGGAISNGTRHPEADPGNSRTSAG